MKSGDKRSQGHGDQPWRRKSAPAAETFEELLAVLYDYLSYEDCIALLRNVEESEPLSIEQAVQIYIAENNPEPPPLAKKMDVGLIAEAIEDHFRTDDRHFLNFVCIPRSLSLVLPHFLPAGPMALQPADAAPVWEEWMNTGRQEWELMRALSSLGRCNFSLSETHLQWDSHLQIGTKPRGVGRALTMGMPRGKLSSVHLEELFRVLSPWGLRTMLWAYSVLAHGDSGNLFHFDRETNFPSLRKLKTKLQATVHLFQLLEVRVQKGWLPFITRSENQSVGEDGSRITPLLDPPELQNKHRTVLPERLVLMDPHNRAGTFSLGFMLACLWAKDIFKTTKTQSIAGTRSVRVDNIYCSCPKSILYDVCGLYDESKARRDDRMSLQIESLQRIRLLGEVIEKGDKATIFRPHSDFVEALMLNQDSTQGS